MLSFVAATAPRSLKVDTKDKSFLKHSYYKAGVPNVSLTMCPFNILAD